VEPGSEGELTATDGEEVTVTLDGTTATVTRSVAETVSVVADPSPPPRTALPEQLVLAKDRYGR
jgi:DtxR family Mn-dependent transcriptional regulator